MNTNINMFASHNDTNLGWKGDWGSLCIKTISKTLTEIKMVVLNGAQRLLEALKVFSRNQRKKGQFSFINI